MKLTKKEADEYGFVIFKDDKRAYRHFDEKGNAAIVLEEDKLYLVIFGVRLEVRNPSLNKIKNLISCFEDQEPELPF